MSEPMNLQTQLVASMVRLPVGIMVVYSVLTLVIVDPTSSISPFVARWGGCIPGTLWLRSERYTIETVETLPWGLRDASESFPQPNTARLISLSDLLASVLQHPASITKAH